MTLTMQPAAFQWGCPLPLKDTAGRTRYTLLSQPYSMGKRLHLLDLAGREAVSIQQQIPSLMPRYGLTVYGRPIGEMVKDPVSGLCRIELPDWSFQGSGYDYEVLRGQQAIGRCRSREDGLLELSLSDHTAALTALAIMLTINCIINVRTR